MGNSASKIEVQTAESVQMNIHMWKKYFDSLTRSVVCSTPREQFICANLQESFQCFGNAGIALLQEGPTRGT